MKLALIGYGKMGHAIEEIARGRGHDIVCIIDAENQQDFDSDAFRSADVAIEFTSPTTAFSNYEKAFAQGVRVVSGSTGWLDRLPEVKAMCAAGKGTMFYSSNFSIGVNIFFEINKYLAKIMDKFAQYDVDVTEIHHIHKLDHPSGTAITISDGITENLSRKNRWTERPTPAADEIKITAEREGEVPGTHIVRYTSPVDKITIAHEAFSRQGLALGAVVAAEWLNGKAGFYGMADMLDL